MVLSLISAQGLGRKNLDVSGINFMLLSLPRSWYRRRGRQPLKVLQNCLHCAWVQKTMGLKKQSTSLKAVLLLRSAQASVVLSWFFIIYFSHRGFCNLRINIFIWLCNCIKIHGNLDASMRDRNLLEDVGFFHKKKNQCIV